MIAENTIKQASRILKNHNINSYLIDAEIILSNIMGVSREFLITNNDINISEKIIKKFNNKIKRRIKKEPVAYITGKKEFWKNTFSVNYSTLIPRPETELLIYKIIKLFKYKRINVLDIGTGSGCILLSILRELPLSKGVGIDISKKAIQTAKKNSKKMNLSNRSNFKAFNINEFNIGRYDLIVSNPPYIPTRDISKLSEDITNYEPFNALNGGHDGLDVIKKIIYKSKHLLKTNGLFALEIGFNQYQRVSSILKQQGFREIHKEYDYKRNIRCIISTKIRF